MAMSPVFGFIALWITFGAVFTYLAGVAAITDGAMDYLLDLHPALRLATFVLAAAIAVPLMPFWMGRDLAKAAMTWLR